MTITTHTIQGTSFGADKLLPKELKPKFTWNARDLFQMEYKSEWMGGEKPMKSVFQVIVVKNDEVVVNSTVVADTEDGAKFEAGANKFHPDKTTIIVKNLGQVKEKKESDKN